MDQEIRRKKCLAEREACMAIHADLFQILKGRPLINSSRFSTEGLNFCVRSTSLCVSGGNPWSVFVQNNNNRTRQQTESCKRAALCSLQNALHSTVIYKIDRNKMKRTWSVTMKRPLASTSRLPSPIDAWHGICHDEPQVFSGNVSLLSGGEYPSKLLDTIGSSPTQPHPNHPPSPGYVPRASSRGSV